jgi:hypothetical protein
MSVVQVMLSLLLLAGEDHVLQDDIWAAAASQLPHYEPLPGTQRSYLLKGA